MVQRRLGVAVDGRFGVRTRRAVQALQATAGLVADGVVGPLTWAALGSAGGSPGRGGATGRPELSLGSSGPAVADAQRLLTRNGFRAAADGRFGPGTFTAVAAFQRQRGLEADGVIGSRTWAGLDSGAGVHEARLVASVSDVWRSIGSRSYVVQTGDTWASIAAAKGSTAAALATANRMNLSRRPSVGSRIQVPGTWGCPVPTGGFINDFGFPRPAAASTRGTTCSPRAAPPSGRR